MPRQSLAGQCKIVIAGSDFCGIIFRACPSGGMADAVVSKTSVFVTCEFDSRLGHQLLLFIFPSNENALVCPGNVLCRAPQKARRDPCQKNASWRAGAGPICSPILSKLAKPPKKEELESTASPCVLSNSLFSGMAKISSGLTMKRKHATCKPQRQMSYASCPVFGNARAMKMTLRVRG